MNKRLENSIRYGVFHRIQTSIRIHFVALMPRNVSCFEHLPMKIEMVHRTHYTHMDVSSSDSRHVI